ncbi:cAMP-binding domain of CRP or a regulatory subunit of cAMP-dependent protein kinases [Flagellimonas taeanensis]|uniref:cAMP-binding domain of CRP or a regulatory subunit of cAMP-dependent protein kinases n=1 Tax=Flagellimonas taeanensis TaxID=1005926 RepID=A0A1M6UVY8_9FLAO|nr:Crp/Fnr family transcriptional regulator [Allomuricauda taeanensis]SFC23137.1 cAMP-binding domain of CRP or a regulatory subunit of cAMP-dependent protein kinases [Allomuricauda taeanensis]SHK73226.1 cAMP-binding domain of CRP or a regulatory subunit of cAMP-dependent protein kinases [Allomuricauda taeanensis]
MNQLIFNIERTFKASEEELSALKSIMKEESLEKNGMFLSSGQVCNKLAFISKGAMRLFYDSPDKEVCNDFFFENSMVGSLASFLSQTPSIVNIAAIEPCTLFVLHREDVIRLVADHESLNKMAQVILQEQLLRAEKREAALLGVNPEERFKNLMEVHPKIFKRIPLHYVASYLGITPETLSRYRTKFLV